MGGPRAATELSASVAGDETYERMDADLRERLLSNGDVLFDIEMATFLSYEPTPQEIEAIEIPCAVTAGADNRDVSVPGHWRYEAAQWLATHLHVPVVELPGGHMPYLDNPTPSPKSSSSFSTHSGTEPIRLPTISHRVKPLGGPSSHRRTGGDRHRDADHVDAAGRSGRPAPDRYRREFR